MLRQSLCAYIEENTQNIKLIATFIISFMICIGYIPHMFLNMYVLYCVMSYTAYFMENNKSDDPMVLLNILGQWVVTSRFIMIEYILGLLLENIFGAMYPFLKIVTYIALLGNDKLSQSYCEVFIVIFFSKCEKYMSQMHNYIQEQAVYFRGNSKTDAKTYIYNLVTNYNNIGKFEKTEHVNNSADKVTETTEATETTETAETFRNDYADEETKNNKSTETDQVDNTDNTDSTENPENSENAENAENVETTNNVGTANESAECSKIDDVFGDDNASETTEYSKSDDIRQVDKTE